jgi:hypothetical protein
MKRADILVYICLGAIFFLLIGVGLQFLEIIDHTKTIQEENRKIPSPYYDLLRPKLPSGNKFFDLMKIRGLEMSLEGMEWRNPAFNCSEKSAYLERYLENRGFNAKIVMGSFPIENVTAERTWVMVEVSNNSWLPIESVYPSLVSPKDKYFDNYFKYSKEFKTIYDACRYNYEEFDWWN